MLYDIGLDITSGDVALPLVNARPAAIVISGADKVRQQIYLTLSTFLAEWFLDTTFGIPYFTEILIKGPSGSKIRSILKAAILDVPDVTSVPTLNLMINKVTRALGVQIVVISDLGKIALAGPLTSLPVGRWGQATWSGSTWGPGSGASTGGGPGTNPPPTSPSTPSSGVWDQSAWDVATWT